MSSDQYNPDKPISAGFYRLEKGTPLVYEYTYDEMKIILEGEFEISDETGQKVTATPGDVFHFPKGAKITFTTPSYGLAFFVSFLDSGSERGTNGANLATRPDREPKELLRRLDSRPQIGRNRIPRRSWEPGKEHDGLFVWIIGPRDHGSDPHRHPWVGLGFNLRALELSIK